MERGRDEGGLLPQQTSEDARGGPDLSESDASSTSSCTWCRVYWCRVYSLIYLIMNTEITHLCGPAEYIVTDKPIFKSTLELSMH